MKIGTRIFNPIEVNLWDVELLQITFYSGMEGNLKRMEECARMCMEREIPYLIHPVSYSIMDDRVSDELKVMARWADLGLILHDVRAEDGGRLAGFDEVRFRRVLDQLREITTVSFENATATEDVVWFWERFPTSITLDIGHLEAAGIDSVDFIRSLRDEVLERVEYVHIHRHDGPQATVPDHWPLTEECREVEALKELLKRRTDVSVILEVNDTTRVGENIELLKKIRDEVEG